MSPTASSSISLIPTMGSGGLLAMVGGPRIGVATFAITATLAGACGESTLGASGESCAAREDCQSGLLCVQQICVETGAAPGSGQIGESCQAPADCAPELACVAGVCIRESSNLTPTNKRCYAVACETKDDCCEDFTPSSNCPAYEQQCLTDPTACGTFHLLCECNQGCEEGLCVDTPPGCAEQAECVSFAAPFCVDGSCRECAGAGDCEAENASCLEGTCVAPCTTDEACPLFSACQAGACVEVGCASDKECAFYLGDDRAKCSLLSECGVPCEADWQCAPEPGQISLDVCVAGVCTFVGCDTDAECRAYLGLENEHSDVQAVCK